MHAQKHKLAEDVDLRQLAQDVPGLVGADLANLLNEAALSAVRDSANTITASHVQVRAGPSASAVSCCLLCSFVCTVRPLDVLHFLVVCSALLFV